MHVIYEGKKKSVAAKKAITVAELLKLVKINPEMVLVKRGEDLLLEDDEVSPKDTIELLKIVSGG